MDKISQTPNPVWNFDRTKVQMTETLKQATREEKGRLGMEVNLQII